MRTNNYGLEEHIELKLKSAALIFRCVNEYEFLRLGVECLSMVFLA